MLKIAISLRFIGFINQSWHLLKALSWNLKPLFKKTPIVTNITLFWFACLTNINFFRNVKSIEIWHLWYTKIHLKVFCVGNIFIQSFFWKYVVVIVILFLLTTDLMIRYLIILVRYLILSQISLYHKWPNDVWNVINWNTFCFFYMFLQVIKSITLTPFTSSK